MRSSIGSRETSGRRSSATHPGELGQLARPRIALAGLLPVCILCFVACQRARAQGILPSAGSDALVRKVGLTQKLNAQLPLTLAFRDESGRRAQLQEYFGRKPVMLNLIQYRCRQLCSQEMQILGQSLKAMKFSVGKQFNVLTVSIDRREGPDLAAAYKAGYLKEYARPGAAGGWHFLTGDEGSIQRLADAVGYHFVYDAQTDQYMHPDGVIILTPEGKVARYFFRLEYPPRDLRLALVEAAKERIGSPLDALALICFHYNPLTGKYSLGIFRALQLGVLAMMLVLGTGVAVLNLRGRYHGRAAASRAGGRHPLQELPPAHLREREG